MTTEEARYVLVHRHEYSNEMVAWAMDIIEQS